MDAQRFLVATVLGGVTLFLAGFLIFGLALANAHEPTGIDREAPLFLWLALAQFVWAALLTMVIDRWPGGSTPGGGFKVAAIVGFFSAAAVGLGFYSMTTLPTSMMTFADPFLAAINFGVGGAAIGWWLGRGTPSPA